MSALANPGEATVVNLGGQKKLDSLFGIISPGGEPYAVIVFYPFSFFH